MSLRLDETFRSDVSVTVMDAVSELDLTPEEIIPGLVQAIVDQAFLANETERLVDEAVDLLTSSAIDAGGGS